MRKMPLFWLGLAALAGVTLFHTAQEVQDKRRQLAHLQNELTKEKESIRVLQAEWSYLNQPERLEKLVAEYLSTLSPLKGEDFVTLDSLDLRPAPLQHDPAPEAPLVSHQITPERHQPSNKAETIKAAVSTATPVTSPVAAPVSVPVAAPVPKPERRPKPVYIRETPQKIIPERLKQKPATPAAPSPVQEAKSAKDFGDVMKSLGVQ